MSDENVPRTYYRACGSFHLYKALYERFGVCSFHQHASLAFRSYQCRLYSVFFESRRPPEIQDKFGMLPGRAIFLVLTPLLIFIVALGILNLIVVRYVKKGADSSSGGSIIYHQLQIASDIGIAILEISPDFFVLTYFANDIFHAATGMPYLMYS